MGTREKGLARRLPKVELDTPQLFDQALKLRAALRISEPVTHANKGTGQAKSAPGHDRLRVRSCQFNPWERNRPERTS